MTKKPGWYNESRRHSLASRGIKTKIETSTVLRDPLGSFDQELIDQISRDPDLKEAMFNMNFTKVGKDTWKMIPKGLENPIDIEVKQYIHPIYDKEVTDETYFFGEKPGVVHIPKEEGTIYRGMSYREYQNALKNGYFRSRGGMNVKELGEGDEMYGAVDPTTAQKYAVENENPHLGGSRQWFRPSRPDAPGIVIAFELNEKWVPGVEGYAGYGEEPNWLVSHDAVPMNEVKGAWKFNVEKMKPGYFTIRRDNIRDEYDLLNHVDPVNQYGKWEKID